MSNKKTEVEKVNNVRFYMKIHRKMLDSTIKEFAKWKDAIAKEEIEKREMIRELELNIAKAQSWLARHGYQYCDVCNAVKLDTLFCQHCHLCKDDCKTDCVENTYETSSTEEFISDSE